MIQSLWNPFRDWNGDAYLACVESAEIQSLWNPFRDWNDYLPENDCKYCLRFKASETLLGIETPFLESQMQATE